MKINLMVLGQNFLDKIKLIKILKKFAKVCRAIKFRFSLRVKLPFQKNILDVWDSVASGKYFKKYKPAHHERNYLQALHNQATVRLMAEHMAKRLGSQIILTSAFIDGTPKFTWSHLGKGTVNGEIGDILVITEVHASKKISRFASFLQAKVTDLENDVQRQANGEPVGKSTKKELDLYENWPPINFFGATRKYDINPHKAKWPFNFSRFLAISKPKIPPALPTIPSWMVGEKAKDSPFSVFNKPKEKDVLSLLEWLCRSAMPSFNESRPLNIDKPNDDFDFLVTDILSNLLVRQGNSKLGHSGGSLISHARGRVLSFGTMDLSANLFISENAVPSNLTRPQIISDSSIQLPAPPGMDDCSDKSMLVLYIVKGEEGDAPSSSPLNESRRNYPGETLL